MIPKTIKVLILVAAMLLPACTSSGPGDDLPTPTLEQTVQAGVTSAIETPPAPGPAGTATNTPEPKPGSSALPFMLGTKADWAAADNLTLQITITEAIRGFAARREIISAGEANPEIPEGYEFIFLRVLVEYPGTDTGPITLSRNDWEAISNHVTMTWADAPVCCLSPGFDFTISAGQAFEGSIALLVAVDDPKPVVGLRPGVEGVGGVYFEAAPETLSETDILYEDDFSSNLSGWQDIYNDDTGVSDYDQGGFRILVGDANFDYWANPGMDFTDVVVEVDATRIGGPEDNVFGLICRYSGFGDFYFLVISSDGFFTIGKYLDGNQQLIGTDAMQRTDLVQLGDVTHHLRAECIGETLRLFVNGVLLYEVADTEHAHGDVGLFAGSFEEAGTDILFDNFAAIAP